MMPKLSLWLLALALMPPAAVGVGIDHAYVQDLAEKLAAAPYQTREPAALPFLRAMSYDDYRSIRFIPEKSLWRNEPLPFRMRLFHLGGLFLKPVAINVFSGDSVRRIPFRREFFDYGKLKVPARMPALPGYAGFLVSHQFDRPASWYEIVAFLGASYFRTRSPGQQFGVSARGLAINAGGPEPEEFPDFVEFWVGQPGRGARSITVHGLLDGPSVAGAYTFIITPGRATLVEVHATLHFRRHVANLGLAPLTSMFWFGENSANHFGDFRPEVHDSDGLLVAPDPHTRLWRPLVNRRASHTTDFAALAPAGFGLLQRDRDYRNYEDTGTRYETRPGLWVEPVGRWPAGRVRLYEFPTTNEYNDNIVAFWSPAQAPEAGTRIDFSYRLHSTSAATFGGPPGRVVATRETVAVEPNRPNRSKFVIDFAGDALKALAAEAPVTAELTLPPKVTALDRQLFRNPVNGTWRLALLVDAPEITNPVELRVRLMLEGKPLTETWVGVWEL